MEIVADPSMTKDKYKYVYGPIYSWRLGMSLGIDPISQSNKVCNLDCIYCQLGKTAHLENERKIFIPTDELINEINSLPSLEIDYLTFSGRGEPTLAKNLGEMIQALKKSRKEKIAVITNSALMHFPDVRSDLLCADFVIAKLDACCQHSFEVVGRPFVGVKFDVIIEGMKDFRTLFKGKFALQIMFIEQNKKDAAHIAKISEYIGADEIQLNTPLRPSNVNPLTKDEMELIKTYFTDFSVVSVYDADHREIDPFDSKDTVKRHGHYKINSFKEKEEL